METSCPPGYQGPGCPEHPQSPPVARCMGCGRLMCAACRTVLGNRNYCGSCVQTVQTPPSFNPVHYQYQSQWQNPAYPPVSPPYGARVARPYVAPVAGVYTYPGQPLREPVFPGAPWGVGEAILIFFIAVAISVALGLVINQVLATLDIASTMRSIILVFVSSVILYALLLGGTFFSVEKRHHSHPAAIGIRVKGAGKGVGLGFGLGLPLFVVALGFAFISSYFYTLIYRALYHQAPQNQFVPRFTGSDTSIWMFVLLVFTLVVLAPVCEEIYFRGYLYAPLRNRMGMQPAMVLNGLLFAAAHFELAGFLPRFVLGYGLCYMYERSRNLTAPIIGHALYNGLLVVLFSLADIF